MHVNNQRLTIQRHWQRNTRRQTKQLKRKKGETQHRKLNKKMSNTDLTKNQGLNPGTRRITHIQSCFVQSNIQDLSSCCMQYILLFCFDLLHWLTGSILVKKMLPHSTGQKITRHNYVLSVQDWCYNTATLTVTVTENIVSMDQGKYCGSRWSLINIRP